MFFKLRKKALIVKHMLQGYKNDNLRVFEKNKGVLSLNTFSINPLQKKEFIVKKLKKGKYRILIFHEDKYILDNRKSILLSFELPFPYSLNKQKKVLGLNKTSKKYNVYEYMGGGRSKNGYFHQDLFFETTKDIPYLKLSIYSLKDRYININSMSLSYPETPIILFDGVKDGVKFSIKERLKKIKSLKKLQQVDFCIYADITPNVIDGSSIWLTSAINILSRHHKLLVLFKDNINPKNNVLGNINKNDNLTLLEPSDLGASGPLSVQDAVEILHSIDDVVPSIKGILTRGRDLAREIQKNKKFNGRHYLYLTDFYEVLGNRILIKESIKTQIPEMLYNAGYILYQTNDIKEKLEEIYGQSIKGIHFPPAIPDGILDNLKIIEQDKGFVHIGYSGKVVPKWGVDDLFELSKSLSKNRIKNKIHIATGKIRAVGKGSEEFLKKIYDGLKEDNVILHENLNRHQCMALMGSMDYVWCYRDPDFENATLEVSTKLIEMSSIGKPCFCYPSSVNIELLGGNYPFFIKKLNTALKIISKKDDHSPSLKKISKKITKEHSFEFLSERVNEHIPEDNKVIDKKICFAGADLKFIETFISYLKKNGEDVRVDNWDWGNITNKEETEDNLDWADIIFCEWGLANAVWYSQNNQAKKPLFIRMHAQEVRDKARKFGAQININNVSKVIFVSEWVRDKALELWGWDKEKTIIIPNFVEDKKIVHDRKGKLKVNLGMVGIVPQIKRFDRAVDLLKELLNRNIDAKLYIKGHRPENLPFMHAPARIKELDYYNEIYSKIDNDKNLKSNIIFDDWGNNVPLWYRNIDFILSPSDTESFHYSLADGVCSGCLPIVWNWEQADKIYTKEWVINDISSAADRVSGLLKKSENTLKKVRQENLKQISSKYGEEKIYKDIISIILDN